MHDNVASPREARYFQWKFNLLFKGVREDHILSVQINVSKRLQIHVQGIDYFHFFKFRIIVSPIHGSIVQTLNNINNILLVVFRDEGAASNPVYLPCKKWGGEAARPFCTQAINTLLYYVPQVCLLKPIVQAVALE